MNENKSSLEKAREATRAMREAGIKPERLDPVERLAKRPTVTNAVKAMCWQCVGCGHDPNPREAIRNCGVTKCALYQFRPYQAKGVEND